MNTSARPPINRVRLLWPILAGATWIASMVWVATQIGVDGVAVGLPISAAVALPIVALILWLDRWERERPRLLISAFAWGACIAAFCAIWSQEGLQALVDNTLGTAAGAWIRPLVITPITEEVFKGLFLVWLLVWRRREITGLVDGIVFAAIIGAGFSFTESILYLGRAVTTFAAADTSDVNAVAVLAVTFFLRVVMVPFFHPFLVAVFGLGVAAAANGRRAGVRIGLPIAGMVLAIVLHGVWDWAGLASDDPLLIYKIYGAVMVPLFLATAITALVLRHREGRMIGAALSLLARDGRIAAEEVAPLASLRERRLWRRDARRRGGRAAARTLGRYQAEASALAIRTTRAQRGGSTAGLDAQAQATAAARNRMLEPRPGVSWHHEVSAQRGR